MHAFFNSKEILPLTGLPLQTPSHRVLPGLPLCSFLLSNPSSLSDEKQIIVFYEWLLEDGSWIPYRKAHQAKLREKDPKQKDPLPQGDCIVELDFENETDNQTKTKYLIDFNTMTQINIASKTSRPFRRVHSWTSAGPLLWKSFPYYPSWKLEPVAFDGHKCASEEVANVVRSFHQACPDHKIIKIEANYNPEKWMNYHRLREDYRKRIHHFEERYLWHG
jgi:hypothetical protein